MTFLDQSLFGFIFQFVVLIQPFIWMKLYSYDLDASWIKQYYYFASYMIIIVLMLSGFNVGYYRNYLIIEYVCLTLYATTLYQETNSFKNSVCLAFLTSFLNSYYWELPWHIVEYVSKPFYSAQLVQLARLTPLLFFYNNYRYNSKVAKYLVAGFFVSVGFMMLQIYTPLDMRYLYTVNRFTCLHLLCLAVVNLSHNQED